MSLRKLFSAKAATPAHTTAGRVMETRQALKNLRAPLATWHSGPPRTPSSVEANASVRLSGPFADVMVEAPPRRIALDDPVFTMGSCFARNLEIALMNRHGRVVNIDLKALDIPAFKDAKGEIRLGYFHRYTPQAMLQEVKRAFGELPGWDEEASLVFAVGDGFIDTHFGWLNDGANRLQDVTQRRAIARDLTSAAADAKLMVFTLGLTEAWRHRPSDLWLNKANLVLLTRRPGDYELHLTSYQETMDCLEELLATLRRHHRTGDFRFVITVSPVPLQATFTGRDIIVANMDSKATLRAAAGAFALRHPDQVSYFPSYEIVLHSDQAQALEADRAHVSKAVVEAIMDRFLDAYVEGGAAAVPRGRLPVRVNSA